MQDAEAFELQGLVSDEEEAGESSMGPRRHEDEEMGKEASHSREKIKTDCYHLHGFYWRWYGMVVTWLSYMRPI